LKGPRKDGRVETADGCVVVFGGDEEREVEKGLAVGLDEGGVSCMN
jgi:hypothetical protein